LPRKLRAFFIYIAQAKAAATPYFYAARVRTSADVTFVCLSYPATVAALLHAML
jgi:hypothetical protein